MGLLTQTQKELAWKRLHMEQPYRATDSRGHGLCHMIPGLKHAVACMDYVEPQNDADKELFGRTRLVTKWAERGIVITRTEAEQIMRSRDGV